METSRDDFIIAIRSAFLKKSNKQRFSLIGLIFFSIILIVLTIINFTPILPSGSFFSDFNITLFWINFSIMFACNKKTNIFAKDKD